MVVNFSSIGKYWHIAVFLPASVARRFFLSAYSTFEISWPQMVLGEGSQKDHMLKAEAHHVTFCTFCLRLFFVEVLLSKRSKMVFEKNFCLPKVRPFEKRMINLLPLCFGDS